jgi:DNA-binding NarL/FixJ family response regulator
MPEGTTIRVLVADISRMTSQLMAASLKRNRSPRLDVLLPAEFTSLEVTKEIVRARPDVALVSTSLIDGPFAGYSVLRDLQPHTLSTRVVLLLEDCERDLVVDAFRSGARGVFVHSEPSSRLPRCIQSVYQGQIWASTRELDYLVGAVVSAKPIRVVNAQGRNILSKREEEVVALVADGLTNREVSERLKLSEHTVKSYLFKVFEKLGISTRVELVLYALSEHRKDSSSSTERGSIAAGR